MATYPVRFVERGMPGRARAVWTGALLGLVPTLAVGGAVAGGIGATIALVGVLWAAGALAKRLGHARYEPGTIRIAEGLVILPDENLGVRHITGGFDIPGTGVMLDFADGTNVVLGVEDEEAAGLLSRLGVAAEQRTLKMPLRRAIGAGVMGLLTWFTSVFTYASLVAGAPGARLEPLPSVALGAILPTLVTIFVVWRFGDPHLVAGRDGIRVHGLRRSGFFPYARITSVERQATDGGADIVLGLEGARPLRLPVATIDDARVEAMIRRIDWLRRSSSGPARAEQLLARGDRTLAAWKEDLARLFARNVGYRDLALSPEEVARVLADPRAATDVRVGAALALRVADPGASAKIRVAAETTADEDVRAALLGIDEEDELLERIGRADRSSRSR